MVKGSFSDVILITENPMSNALSLSLASTGIENISIEISETTTDDTIKRRFIIKPPVHYKKAP